MVYKYLETCLRLQSVTDHICTIVDKSFIKYTNHYGC